MAVPEAALHENGGLVAAQHQVRCAGQLADVEAVSETCVPDSLTDVLFSSRAAIADAGHECRAAVLCEEISHLF